MRRIILFVSALCLCCAATRAQNAFWSNTGLVSIDSGAFVSIQGDAYNRDSGYYYNYDSIFLTGNWSHSAPNTCFDSTRSGWVYMYAGNQHINGTSVTHFNNLVLEDSGVKYGNIDVVVQNKLFLTDREFHMDTNTAWVLNPDTAAIQRSSGYVSSLQNGGLVRRTDTTLPYLFPVGSDTVTFRYRPVMFQPAGISLNHFKARFANFNPTVEGYDINIKDSLVCQVNPNWYHRLYHVSGTDTARITIFYDTTADGQWNDIVHWQNLPEWEPIHAEVFTYGLPLASISKLSWANYVYPPFALGITLDTTASASNGGPYCSYDTIQLFAAPGGNYTYQWTGPDSFSSTQQNPTLQGAGGVYKVVVTNSYGCYSSAVTTVVIKASPDAQASNFGPYCAYDTVALNAGPANELSYQWSGPDSFSTWLQNPTVIPNGTTSISGVYTVTVTNVDGCTASASTNVLVKAAATLTVSNGGPVCSDSSVGLMVQPSGMEGYQWSGPGGFTSNQQNPVAPPNSEGGTYTVTVTDTSGCTGSASTDVNIYPNPIADAGIDTLIWKTDTIQLYGRGAENYVWTPNYNLSCTTCSDPLAWPDSTLFYYLTVIDEHGCSSIDSVLVLAKTKPPFLVFIPNVITPNGDGINDTWYIRDLEGFQQNEVVILNRWGDQVFSQNPYQNNWGGTWDGHDLPGGTYYYILKVFYNGEWVKFDGPITIVR